MGIGLLAASSSEPFQPTVEKTSIFLIPTFKSGSFKEPNNYRGIPVMSRLGKLFALLVHTRLYAWAERNGKLSQWQGGFWRRMGCDTQCFRLLASILKQFSRNKAKRIHCKVEFLLVLLTSKRHMIQ